MLGVGGHSSISAEPPATTQTVTITQAAIDDDVLLLADPDPRVRDAATNRLSIAGKRAEAALRLAAEEGHPEAMLRARWLLSAIDFALPADTPTELRAKLLQYQNADPNARVAIARDVLKDESEQADAVIVAMWSMTRTGPLVPQIEQRLINRFDRVARGMLWRGNDAGALRLAELVARRNDQVAGIHWAALVCSLGQSEEMLASLTADTSHEGRRLLVYLLRATGETEKALQAARNSENKFLIEQMLYENARWKELAELNEKEPDRNSVEDLTLLAALRRRAEPRRDPVTLDSLLTADEQPEKWYTTKGMLLADSMERATITAINHDNYHVAIELRCQQLQFDKAVALVEDAHKNAKPEIALAAEATLVLAMHKRGLQNEVQQRTTAMREKAKASNDPDALLKIIRLNARIGNTDIAWEDAASLVQGDTEYDTVVSYLTTLGVDPSLAKASWQIVPPALSTLSRSDQFRRIGDLVNGSVTREEADRWLKHTKVEFPIDKEFSVIRLRDSLIWSRIFGTPNATIDRANQILQLPEIAVLAANNKWETARGISDLLLTIVDIFVQAERYTEAAAIFEMPNMLAGYRPAIVYNAGWALLKSGDEIEGRRRMDLAKKLAMADVGLMASLVDAMKSRGELEAAKEYQLAVSRMGAFRSWHLGNALREQANDPAIREQFLTRADLYDRWFLDTTSMSTSFPSATDYPTIAAMIHIARARGLMQAGDFAGASAFANLSLAADPSRVDDLIDLVVRFDKADQKELATDFFDRTYRILAAHRDAFPNEGQPHNGIAWFAALCDRQMDDAERDARRAVAIAPDNAAFIDTLAEVRFRQGHVKEAIELIDKALVLKPDMKHLSEQRERFVKAQTESN